MTESETRKLVPALGNLVALTITEQEGEGLIIKWVNSSYQDTLISSEGNEADMYKFIRQKYPDLKKAAGAGLKVISDESGALLEIGEINGPSATLRTGE